MRTDATIGVAGGQHDHTIQARQTGASTMQPIKRQEIDLFKVAGVQIAIDYSWLIIFALVLWSLSAGYFPALHPGNTHIEYWIVGLVATLLFFASIVIHELSHAVVANRLGQPIERISLFIFG